MLMSIVRADLVCVAWVCLIGCGCHASAGDCAQVVVGVAPRLWSGWRLGCGRGGTHIVPPSRWVAPSSRGVAPMYGWVAPSYFCRSRPEHTPSLRMSFNAFVSIAHALFVPGYDINKADQDGVTPLILSCINGCINCVRALLVAGADPNKANNEGVTALIKAAEFGHDLCTHALLEAGADPNKANNEGVTALILSIP